MIVVRDEINSKRVVVYDIFWLDGSVRREKIVLICRGVCG